jgi:hypothetical protein
VAHRVGRALAQQPLEPFHRCVDRRNPRRSRILGRAGASASDRGGHGGGSDAEAVACDGGLGAKCIANLWQSEEIGVWIITVGCGEGRSVDQGRKVARKGMRKTKRHKSKQMHPDIRVAFS